jgi:hypothetical protein
MQRANATKRVLENHTRQAQAPGVRIHLDVAMTSAF